MNLEAGRAPVGGELEDKLFQVVDTAADKLIRLGQRAGVSPEQIVTLLDSGMDVRELIHHLVSRINRCPEARQQI